MAQEPNSLPTWSWFFIAASVIAVLSLVWTLTGGWLDYANNTLLWDSQQTAAITYSGMAVLFALLILLGQKAVHRAGPEQTEKRRNAQLSLVYQPLGWTFLLLSYTLSEARDVWHVPRELFFALAAIASTILLGTNVQLYRTTKEKSVQISFLFGAVVWLAMLGLVVARFISGSPEEGIFR